MPGRRWAFRWPTQRADRVDVKPYYDTYWSDHGYNPVGDLTPSVSGAHGAAHPARVKTALTWAVGMAKTVGPWLLAHGCRYVGLDVSETAVRQATASGLDARRIDDASALPFEDGSFDIGLMVEEYSSISSPRTLPLQRCTAFSDLVVSSW